MIARHPLSKLGSLKITHVHLSWPDTAAYTPLSLTAMLGAQAQENDVSPLDPS